MQIEAALRDQVEKAIGRSIPQAIVQKLQGHASNRSYYRVGAYPQSYIAMVMPVLEAKHSEEVSAPQEAPPELPFINIHRYLELIGVRVPRIFRYDESAGILILEDLGETTFEHALLGRTDREHWYARAIDLLARLRVRAEKMPDSGCLAFSRAFDENLYDGELHHFREWGMEAWSGRKPSAAERAALDAIFRRLSAQLAAEPRGFTHRDYQSRNIMVKHGELVLIDFQDALQGPRQYDLVALLRDSYVELDWNLVDRMLDRYIAAFEREGGGRIQPGPFKRFFDLLTIQRKLKDAARFEYIHQVKGNPSFLASIPASLRYAAAALKRRSDFGDLHEIAARYVSALA